MTNLVKLAEEVKSGSFHLICPDMKVVVGVHRHEVVLSGVGVIRSGKDGLLTFRMVTPISSPLHTSLKTTTSPGAILDPNEAAKLVARDEYGREWHSGWMTMTASLSPFSNSYRLAHRLRDIMTVQSRPHASISVSTIVVPKPPDLPYDQVTERTDTANGKPRELSRSVDHHCSYIDDSEVFIRHQDREWLTITTTKQSAVMPDWPGLVLQVLSILTSQTLTPVVSVRDYNDRSALHIFSGPYWRYSLPMPGPVFHDTSPAQAKVYWCFFDKALQHFSERPQYLVDLFDELEAIRTGSQGSLQTQCLTLAVGIESLSQLLLGAIEVPIPSQEAYNSLRAHLDAWKEDVGMRARAIGLLSNLRTPSATARLYAWASQTCIDRALIDRWKKLRPKVAHGSRLCEDQEVFDLYYSSVELLYRMIAYKIGYGGPILQTSRRDWGLGESSSIGSGGGDSQVYKDE